MRQQYRDDWDEAVDDEAGDGPLVEPAGPMVIASGPTALAARLRVADQAARRVPYLATAATGGLGLTALGLVEAATAAGQPALAGSIAVGTWIVTGAGLPVLRIKFRDRIGVDGCTEQRIPAEYRRRWWLAGGAAALWVDAMAAGAVHAVGPSGMAAILLGGAWALSARWMRDHDVEQPADPPPVLPPAPPPAVELPPPPPPPPAPPAPDEGDLIAELWETRVAAGANAIAAGSELGDDRLDLPFGYQWVVQLDPDGNIGCTSLCDRAADIALKLGMRTTHVDVDHLEGDDDREDRALLTVITRDVLKDGVPYRGPVYQDGRIPLGMFADGSGHPHWVTRDSTGPQPGMVTGGTGSGKSQLLARLGMAYRKSGEWIVLFGDGDEQGRSAPLLKRIAYDFAAGPDEVLEQLEALEAWFLARGDVMGGLTEDEHGRPVPMRDPRRQEPAEKIMPCRAYPGFVWILDEYHRLATNPTLKAAGFTGRVSKLLRVMRKVGGTIIVGTQSGQIADFGDDDVFRGQLAAGNCVIMRTKNKTERYVVADFGVNPGILPKGGGYGFVDDDGRKMMFRGEYSPHMARWVSTLPEYRPDELPALVYASKRPPKPADPVVDYEETQQRLAAIRNALQAGGPLPWEEQPEEEEPAPQPALPSAAVVGGDGWSAGGVGIAAPILGPMFAAPAAQPAPTRALTGPEQAVLERLVAADGRVKNAVIIAGAGLADSAVSKALRGLVSVGCAVRHGHGLHEVTAAGRVAAARNTTPANGEYRGGAARAGSYASSPARPDHADL
ncbi:hypothetical protein ACU61A_41085 [Pseudonocardia sichuanensis]